MQLKILLGLILSGFVIALSGCGNSNAINNKLSLSVIDMDIEDIQLNTCNSSIKLNASIGNLTYEHTGCSNTDYHLVLIYKDGFVVDENFGYIPGGESVHHKIIVRDRKIESSTESN